MYHSNEDLDLSLDIGIIWWCRDLLCYGDLCWKWATPDNKTWIIIKVSVILTQSLDSVGRTPGMLISDNKKWLFAIATAMLAMFSANSAFSSFHAKDVLETVFTHPYPPFLAMEAGEMSPVHPHLLLQPLLFLLLSRGEGGCVFLKFKWACLWTGTEMRPFTVTI